MKEKKNGLLIFVFVLFYILLGWTIVFPLLATHIIMKSSFGTRVTETVATIDEKYYPNLIKKPIFFRSAGHKINGALFYYESKKPFKGLVVVSHGIGCGMNNYLNRGEYFARHGYLVMGFDMTGCCESEGKGMIGLQQGAIDLHNAVIFASKLPEAQNLKIFVYGHSWSGYASAAMLNYKDSNIITAVATCCGFNNYWDTMQDQAERRVGKMFIVAKPFCRLYCLLTFGKTYNYEGMKGINKYNKPVLIVHSKDDPTVPYKLGVIAHKDECTNPNVEYLEFEDRGHTISRPVEAETRIMQSLEGIEPLPRNGKNVFQYNVDKKYYNSSVDDVFAIDDEFMDKILDFFERAARKEA